MAKQEQTETKLSRFDAARHLGERGDRLVVLFSQAADVVASGNDLDREDVEALRECVADAEDVVENEIAPLVDDVDRDSKQSPLD